MAKSVEALIEQAWQGVTDDNERHEIDAAFGLMLAGHPETATAVLQVLIVEHLDALKDVVDELVTACS